MSLYIDRVSGHDSFLSNHYLTALLISLVYLSKIKTNVGKDTLQSAFIAVILFGHTKGQPEDRSSVLDSTSIVT